MTTVFSITYLGLPTQNQLKQLLTLYEVQHGVKGMIGSLDTMHCKWKKCLKAYQGAFKGAKQGPTVMLEAVSDYNLYFWHAAFGFPRSLNNINILNLSPLMTSFLDGTFYDPEPKHVPYKIHNEIIRILNVRLVFRNPSFRCLIDHFFKENQISFVELFQWQLFYTTCVLLSGLWVRLLRCMILFWRLTQHFPAIFELKSFIPSFGI